MSTPVYKVALDFTLERENYYSNNPGDPGGETVWGIAFTQHPEWPGWPIVEELRDQPAFPESIRTDVEIDLKMREFYAAIWSRMGCQVCRTQQLATVLFDTAVNPGEFAATRMLQRALNYLCLNGGRWKPVVIDGKFGPETTAALMASAREHGVLAEQITGLRMTYYVEKTEENPKKRANARGWLLRSIACTSVEMIKRT